ncbi:MAG: hypothetical protein FWF11_00635 [Coriobacteriia bacterium]|nr:hypothetical protein [Coriobacteriia bacterium]
MKEAIMKRLAGLRRDCGQGVAEYVIILAVVVIACIILAIAFHEQLAGVWESVTSQLGSIR